MMLLIKYADGLNVHCGVALLIFNGIVYRRNSI